LGIEFCPVVLNQKQVIAKRAELCPVHTLVFQNGRLQALSGNAIQRFIDMNNYFDTVVYFIVGGNSTYGANDLRVIHGSPPWGLHTVGWPVAMNCLITVIRGVDSTLFMDYYKQYF
jgi:hypothetical protein